MLSDWMYRLRALLRRSTVERELEDELRFHIEQETAKYLRTGENPEDALRRARLALGGLSKRRKSAATSAAHVSWMTSARICGCLPGSVAQPCVRARRGIVSCPRHWGEHRRVYGYLWRVVPGALLS